MRSILADAQHKILTYRRLIQLKYIGDSKPSRVCETVIKVVTFRLNYQPNNSRRNFGNSKIFNDEKGTLHFDLGTSQLFHICYEELSYLDNYVP